jgi:AbrB family looped-hinge helix DNA binding protein
MRKMIVKTVRVSDKGQISIPQSIRETTGICKGDELIIVQTDGKILLEKAEHFSEELRDDFKDLLLWSEKSLKRVWDNKEDEVWNRYLRKCK